MENLILKEKEVKRKIMEDINNSKLPAFILKYIIKDFFEQLVKEEEEQYKLAQKKKGENNGNKNKRA